MSKQITNNYANDKKGYKNNKSIARIQGERIGNYSELLIKTLEPYAYYIEPVVGAFNKKASSKTMALKLVRMSDVRIQNRATHQNMVKGLAVECARQIGLNTRVN